MNLFGLFRRGGGSAPVARERLQLLLAHERAATGKSNLIAALREEILAVIARHVPVKPEQVQVKMTRRKAVSMLKIDVEMPAVAAGTPG
jgi:cell division topological specificity factor